METFSREYLYRRWCIFNATLVCRKCYRNIFVWCALHEYHVERELNYTTEHPGDKIHKSSLFISLQDKQQITPQALVVPVILGGGQIAFCCCYSHRRCRGGEPAGVLNTHAVKGVSQPVTVVRRRTAYCFGRVRDFFNPLYGDSLSVPQSRQQS